MTEVERYKKMKAEFEGMHSKLAGLPGLIGSLKEKSMVARDEAVRMELLGDHGALEKRAGSKAAQDEIRKHEVEREDLEHRRGIMQEVLSELRKKSEAELADVYKKAFGRALKNLILAFRTAHKAEVELAAVREAAKQAFDEIDSAGSPVPSWIPLLMRDFGSEAMKPELNRFLDSMKIQGFDVS